MFIWESLASSHQLSILDRQVRHEGFGLRGLFAMGFATITHALARLSQGAQTGLQTDRPPLERTEFAGCNRLPGLPGSESERVAYPEAQPILQPRSTLSPRATAKSANVGNTT